MKASRPYKDYSLDSRPLNSAEYEAIDNVSNVFDNNGKKIDALIIDGQELSLRAPKKGLYRVIGREDDIPVLEWIGSSPDNKFHIEGVGPYA